MSGILRRWNRNQCTMWWWKPQFRRRMQLILPTLKWLSSRLLDFSTQSKNWNSFEIQSHQNHQAWNWEFSQNFFVTRQFSVIAFSSADKPIWAGLQPNQNQNHTLSNSLRREDARFLYSPFNRSNESNDHWFCFWLQHWRLLRPDFSWLWKNPIQKLNSNTQFLTQRR